jgi:signal transduction histidine kinase
MLTPASIKGRFQVDWLISNLRWLLLVSIALVIFIAALIQQGPTFDPLSILPQILMLGIAVLYNLIIMLLLIYGTWSRFLPVLTLLIDTALTIGFVANSGGLSSPLLSFALFPILTAALRFPWGMSVTVAGIIIVGTGVADLLWNSTPLSLSDVLFSFIAPGLILMLAALVSGLVGDRVKQRIAHARRIEEEAELRKLRAAHEHARVVFELASTLSATLNYNKVLEAMLEVGETGMRDLGQASLAHISLVLLFGQSDLRIASSRHLNQRDQKVHFEGKQGALAESLTTAEPAIVDDPSNDPELGQLIAMHSCREAIVVPLRAGFENFGAVVFGSSQASYTEDHIDLLIAIGNQAIVALQNAQLYQSLMEEKERIVAVEEDARKKLARDLHDGPTQSIAAIAMRLNYVQMVVEKEPERVREELTYIEDLARRTTKEIRHMLFTLRPLILETQGLRAALEQYINKLTDLNAPDIHLKAPPNLDQYVDRNVQGVMFYIIEEAIGNARKHSQADNIWVDVSVTQGQCIAEVRDDGVGFDVDAVQVRYDERGSLGMINMHERAELIDGQIRIASAPGEGTRIRLTFPLRKG